MLQAAGSPLVSGMASGGAMEIKTLKVRVLRPFLLKGERKEVGATFDMERRLATELAAANKVELLHPEKAIAAAVGDMKPAVAAPAKKVAKEPSNAGQ